MIILVLACGIRVLPIEKVWPRILFTVLLLIGSYGCFCKYQQKSKTVEACKQWTKSRMFYHSGAYQQAVESYAEIQKEMKGNARFMFEYGHALHKLHEPELSNKVLKEALKVSGDPMILNIIGKNEQDMKHYDSAEYSIGCPEGFILIIFWPIYMRIRFFIGVTNWSGWYRRYWRKNRKFNLPLSSR